MAVAVRPVECSDCAILNAQPGSDPRHWLAIKTNSIHAKRARGVTDHEVAPTGAAERANRLAVDDEVFVAV